MEGDGDAERNQQEDAAEGAGDVQREGEDNTAAEGDGDADRARYSFPRCLSQSSLDESSQAARPPAPPASPPAPHAARLLHELQRLRADRHLTDVCLMARPSCGVEGVVAEGAAAEGAIGEGEAAEGADGEGAEAVWAHRAVLAAGSPYFRAMFTQFTERDRRQVTIGGVEPQALRALVDYLYCPDSLTITEDNVQSLLSASCLLAVAGAAALAGHFLAAALCPDNALGIRAFALQRGCGDLAAAATAHLTAHFAAVLAADEWLALDPATMAELLDSDRLTVPNEEVILDAVIRWVQHEPDSRLSSLPVLLERVRLPLVRQEALVTRAAGPPLCSAGVRVKDLLIEALSFHLQRPERRAELAATCPRARPRRPPRAPPLLLVVGGQAPKAIRDVEIYDVEAGSWRTASPLPSRRCRAGVAAVGGRVYAVGGFNGTLRVRSVDVLDVEGGGQWAAGPALAERRSTLGVAVLGPFVYAVGGFDGAKGLSSAEVLDSRDPAGSWRPVASMSSRRSSVGVCALGGRLYAVGGYDGVPRQCLHTVERYDPATDTWEAVAPMAARRSGAGVGVVGGALYAVGGHDGPAVRRSVERYTEQGGWAAVSPMTHARRNAGVVPLGGRLYVLGGDDGAANLATCEVYDPSTDTWSMIPECMGVARSYAGVCVLQRPVPA